MRGIGRYTAGAMLSFAFRRDAAVVDTNVRRVLGRVFLGPRRLARLRGQKTMWDLSEALLAQRTRLRLESGADGLRRHLVHRARAALPPVSHAPILRELSRFPAR